MNHAIVVFNVLAMRTIGLFLALLVPNNALNVVFGNTFAQLCMLTNGFYTKLPTWFQIVTWISIPRYTLKALLKLEFSWRDTFEVHPMRGNAGFGYPTSWLPAEMTMPFQIMYEREMDIMQAPHDSSAWPEFAVLVGITVSFGFFFAIGLLLKISQLELLSKHVIDGDFSEIDTPWTQMEYRRTSISHRSSEGSGQESLVSVRSVSSSDDEGKMTKSNSRGIGIFHEKEVHGGLEPVRDMEPDNFSV
jgi:hypothetical protein